MGMDAFGHTTAATLGNGVVEAGVFNSRTGWAERLSASKNSTKVHDLGYTLYDEFGNLKGITNYQSGLQESYGYDKLHRLTSSSYQNTGLPGTVYSYNYSYDAVGNLTQKSDYASSYSYGNSARNLGGNAGPNAVRQVSKVGGGTASFTYDNQGNLLSGDGMVNTYNAFKQPLTTTRNGTSFTFTYSAMGERVKEVRGSTTTYEIDKAYEFDAGGNWRLDVEGIATINFNGSSYSLRYAHRDRLGSGASFTDENGNPTDRRAFDPFGKPRAHSGAELSPKNLFGYGANNLAITRKGFTDHRHLDEAQLIHMTKM